MTAPILFPGRLRHPLSRHVARLKYSVDGEEGLTVERLAARLLPGQLRRLQRHLRVALPGEGPGRDLRIRARNDRGFDLNLFGLPGTISLRFFESAEGLRLSVETKAGPLDPTEALAKELAAEFRLPLHLVGPVVDSVEVFAVFTAASVARATSRGGWLAGGRKPKVGGTVLASWMSIATAGHVPLDFTVKSYSHRDRRDSSDVRKVEVRVGPRKNGRPLVDQSDLLRAARQVLTVIADAEGLVEVSRPPRWHGIGLENPRASARQSEVLLALHALDARSPLPRLHPRAALLASVGGSDSSLSSLLAHLRSLDLIEDFRCPWPGEHRARWIRLTDLGRLHVGAPGPSSVLGPFDSSTAFTDNASEAPSAGLPPYGFAWLARGPSFRRWGPSASSIALLPRPDEALVAEAIADLQRHGRSVLVPGLDLDRDLSWQEVADALNSAAVPSRSEGPWTARSTARAVHRERPRTRGRAKARRAPGPRSAAGCGVQKLWRESCGNSGGWRRG
ncbi:hypothetical protein L6R53_13570 [Myxococcota bacterium]|nr:hypothetical protein [Myxococcota bacterium]